MQAYGDEREKGLFTFYRQQADLQDKLKAERLQLKQKELSRKQKKSLPPPPKVIPHIKKIQEQPLMNSQQLKQTYQIQQKKDENSQHRKKLLQILERNKYKNMKMHNLKRLLIQTTPSNDQLRNHLSAILGEDKIKKYQKGDKKDRKQSALDSQQSHFQRLALCPTNFDLGFQEKSREERRMQRLKTRSVESTLNEYKKMEQMVNISSNIEQKEKQKDKQIQQIIKRHFLPKYQLRSNSQMSKLPNIKRQKSPMASSRAASRARKLSNLSAAIQPIVNERYSKIKQDSFMIENSMTNHKPRRKRLPQNKIYPIFIESNSDIGFQQQNKISKEKMYLQVIRRLKFK